MKKLTKAISLIAGIITCSQTAIMGMYPSREELSRLSDSEVIMNGMYSSAKLSGELKRMSPNQREEKFYELVYHLSNKSQDIIDAAIQQQNRILEYASMIGNVKLLEQCLNIAKNAIKTYKDSGKKIDLPKTDYNKMNMIVSQTASVCMFADRLS